MQHFRLEFNEEIFVLRVVLSLRDLVSGELPDRGLVSPERNGAEMSFFAFGPLQDVYGQIPWN